MMTPARILIGVPCGDQCQSFFAADYGRMMAYTGMNLVGKGQPIQTLTPLFAGGTLIAPQRYAIVKAALERDATHILWLDSDMRFPADTLARLLARNRDIVGVNYCARRFPCGTTSFNFAAADAATMGIPTLVYTYPESTGCEKVTVMGFGVSLMRTEVFRKVPEPWFPLQWAHYPNGEWGYNGEDTGFLAWARDAGYGVWIDHDLSQEIGHLGSMTYTMAHALEMRPAMKDSRFIVERHDAPDTAANRDGPSQLKLVT